MRNPNLAVVFAPAIMRSGDNAARDALDNKLQIVVSWRLFDYSTRDCDLFWFNNKTEFVECHFNLFFFFSKFQCMELLLDLESSLWATIDDEVC